MMLISPIMIFVFAMIARGAIGLYFIVGGLFALLQSLILHFQRPGFEKRVAREFKVKKTADDLLADRAPTASGTPAAPEAKQTTDASQQSKRNRNAGKQQR